MPFVSAAAQKRCVKKAGTRMDVCRFVTAHRFCCPCALLYVARKGMCARETLVGFPLHVKSSARRRPLLRSKSACTKKEGHPYECPSFLVRVAIQNFLKNIVISMVSGFRTTKFLACNFIFSPQIQGDCWKTVAFFYTQVNPIKDVEIRVEKPLFYPLWFAFQSEHECFPMW